MNVRFVSIALAAALLAAQAGIFALTGYADRGVALSTGVIEVKDAISTGRTYDLPSIVVRNPGDELTKYRMSVETQSGPGLQADPTWFTLSPAEFTLLPGTTQEVAVAIAIPSRAKADSYSALLVASVAQGGQGATVGAAAATRLEFRVQGGQGGFNILAPAFYALLAAGSLGTGGWLLRRKLLIRIERRPSP